MSQPPEPVRIEIDLNVRVGTGGQLTYSGYEDVQGGPVPDRGVSVVIFESESGVEAPAIVVDRDDERRILYLAVAWNEIRDIPGHEDPGQDLDQDPTHSAAASAPHEEDHRD